MARLTAPDRAPMLNDLEAAVTAARQLFGAAACSCALVDDDGGELEFVAASGAGADAIIGVRLPVNRGIAGWAATSGEPIGVADVERDARFARDVAESTAYIPKTVLAAPLMSWEGEVSGVVEILDPGRQDSESRLGEHRGTGAELGVLTLVASQLAAVVRLHGELSSAQHPETGDELDASLRSLVGVGPEGRRLAATVLEAVAEFVEGSR